MNQPARSQKRAAEVSRHHGGNLSHAAVQQHGEHWSPGRSLGFAVVAAARKRRAARRSRLKRPAVVRGIRMFNSDALDESLGLIGPLYACHRNNEAAAADHLFFTVNLSGRKIGNVVAGH